MHLGADKLRNVALVGHRGSGKTLAERGAAVPGGGACRGWGRSPTAPPPRTPTRTSRAGRCRSRPALSSFTWQDRKINLLDTPGDVSFVADAPRRPARVASRAVFVVNGRDGRRGLDHAPVGRRRRRARHRAHGLREHARPRAGRLLPHARGPQGRLRAARGRHGDPDRRPSTTSAASWTSSTWRAYEYASTTPVSRDGSREIPIPDDLAEGRAGVPRRSSWTRVAEVSEALMERYLEGEGHLPPGDRDRPEGRPRTTARSSPWSAAVANAQPRDRPAAGRDRGGPPVAGQARADGPRRGRPEPLRRRPALRLRLQDEGRRVRRGASTSSASTRAS